MVSFGKVDVVSMLCRSSVAKVGEMKIASLACAESGVILTDDPGNKDVTHFSGP
jgi:hypothetical protein